MRTDLHAEAFFTADHAVVESGKLYVNGGAWNRVAYPSYPAVQAVGVAAVLHIPWRAHNQSHAFLIEFEDADGLKMPAQLEDHFQASLPADARAGDYSVLPVSVMVNGFVFQRPGEYAAVLSVDGTEISRWRWRAVQTVGVPGAIPLDSPTSPPGSEPPPAE